MRTKTIKPKELINRAVVLLYAAISVILIVNYLIELKGGRRTVSYLIVFTILVLAPMVINIPFYRKDRETPLTPYILGFGYTIFYVYAMATSTIPYSAMYIVPMLFVLMGTQNVKLMVGINTISVVANLAHVFYRLNVQGMQSNVEYVTGVKIQLAVVLLALVLTTYVTSVLKKTTELQMANMKEMLDKNLSVDRIASKESNTVLGMVKSLQNASGTSVSHMADVTQSAQNVASSVQEQTELVHDSSNKIEEVVGSVDRFANDTTRLVKESESVQAEIETLVSSVQQTNTMAQETQQCMNELVAAVSAVEAATQFIEDISMQTNLLALNAAIEASHCGEAGKGFAVLADQIRALSTSADASAKDINGKVKLIINSSHNADEKLESLTQTFQTQAGLIHAAGETFAEINSSMINMNSECAGLKDSTAAILSSNERIAQLMHTILENSTRTADTAAEVTQLSRHNDEMVSKIEQATTNIADLHSENQQ